MYEIVLLHVFLNYCFFLCIVLSVCVFYKSISYFTRRTIFVYVIFVYATFVYAIFVYAIFVYMQFLYIQFLYMQFLYTVYGRRNSLQLHFFAVAIYISFLDSGMTIFSSNGFDKRPFGHPYFEDSVKWSLFCV